MGVLFDEMETTEMVNTEDIRNNPFCLSNSRERDSENRSKWDHGLVQRTRDHHVVIRDISHTFLLSMV
jgi:hypothetical protein